MKQGTIILIGVTVAAALFISAAATAHGSWSERLALMAIVAVIYSMVIGAFFEDRR